LQQPHLHFFNKKSKTKRKSPFIPHTSGFDNTMINITKRTLSNASTQLVSVAHVTHSNDDVQCCKSDAFEISIQSSSISYNNSIIIVIIIIVIIAFHLA
jgi:hypothetical protein